MDRDQVKSFVKCTLGCKCPDEVFERVYCECNVHLTDQLYLHSRIEIGDRLLIYVAEAPNIEFIKLNLPTLVAFGIQERNTKRLNRFRLVLLSPRPRSLSRGAVRLFCSLRTDDKVNLHVICNKDFPRQ